MLQQVTLPTREGIASRSFIDHFNVKSNRKLKTYVVLSTISDHYATLTSFVNVAIGQ